MLWLYRRKGWTIHGLAPAGPRCIIVGAPHTSNWDFVFFLGVTHQLGIRPRFMGKDSLFRWPLRRFMFEMGGVPVVRSKSHNYVEQMIAQFAAHDDFMLVVAPEGSRSSSGRWRSGFYHIAMGAGVPIVPAWVDNVRLAGGFGPAMMLTGDYSKDMQRIAGFFETVMPGHPKLAMMNHDNHA